MKTDENTTSYCRRIIRTRRLRGSPHKRASVVRGITVLSRISRDMKVLDISRFSPVVVVTSVFNSCYEGTLYNADSITNARARAAVVAAKDYPLINLSDADKSYAGTKIGEPAETVLTRVITYGLVRPRVPYRTISHRRERQKREY